jgi:hypothetical protein
MNIFASLVFGEFNVAQGETTSSIRIAASLGSARNSGRGWVGYWFGVIDRIVRVKDDRPPKFLT